MRCLILWPATWCSTNIHISSSLCNTKNLHEDTCTWEYSYQYIIMTCTQQYAYQITACVHPHFLHVGVMKHTGACSGDCLPSLEMLCYHALRIIIQLNSIIYLFINSHAFPPQPLSMKRKDLSPLFLACYCWCSKSLLWVWCLIMKVFIPSETIAQLTSYY